MEHKDHQEHILIIGAGITGLLVAHGLAKSGIAFTIFDAEDESTTRFREWTMGIHWAVPLLDELLPAELMSRISEACVDKSLDYVTPPLNGSRIYDGVTGEVLKELVSVGKLLRVSRRKMRALCKEGIDVQHSHILKEVTCNADGTVTGAFMNGVQASGTVLIGCDGPRSVVRSCLFSDPDAAATSMSDLSNLTATFSYGDAEKARFVRTAHPVWSMMLHPDMFTYICVQDVPDPDKPEDWQYFVFLSWLGTRDDSLTNAQRLELVKDKAAKIQEPFRSAVQWIPDNVELPFSDLGYWVTKPWDSKNGRITLAGDAAHPMPPYRGQGLNHAIQDAHNFVKTMTSIRDSNASGMQAQAVQAYSDEVTARGAEETMLSTKNAYMMIKYDEAKNSPYMKYGLNKQDGAAKTTAVNS